MGPKRAYFKKYQRLFVWLALVFLILVSCSAFFAAKRENAGATTLMQLDASQTASASSSCAHIGVHLNNEIPTAQSSPTTNVATPAPPSWLPAPSATPAFSDNFTDNSKGWFLSSGPIYTRAMQNNELILCATEHKPLVEDLPTNITFDNFVLTTDFTFIKADGNDSISFYLRSESVLGNDYRIDIFANKTVQISKEYMDDNNVQQSVLLASHTNTTVLNRSGQSNTLSIMMVGPLFTIVINNTTISKIADMDYTQGDISLSVNNGPTSSGIAASFRQMTVTPLVNMVTPTPGPSVTSNLER